MTILPPPIQCVGCGEVVFVYLLRFDYVDEFWVFPVVRVDDVDTRGAVPRNDEVSPFQAADVTGGGTGVPAEVVEFVSFVREADTVGDFAVVW